MSRCGILASIPAGEHTSHGQTLHTHRLRQPSVVLGVSQTGYSAADSLTPLGVVSQRQRTMAARSSARYLKGAVSRDSSSHHVNFLHTPKVFSEGLVSQKIHLGVQLLRTSHNQPPVLLPESRHGVHEELTRVVFPTPCTNSVESNAPDAARSGNA